MPILTWNRKVKVKDGVLKIEAVDPADGDGDDNPPGNSDGPTTIDPPKGYGSAIINYWAKGPGLTLTGIQMCSGSTNDGNLRVSAPAQNGTLLTLTDSGVKNTYSYQLVGSVTSNGVTTQLLSTDPVIHNPGISA
jgi:hypothetical protein